MKSRLKQRIFALSLLAWTAVCPADAQQTRLLRDQFLSPSDEAKPWTFWYWMYGAVSKEGITADLEAMKHAGLGGTYLMPIKGIHEGAQYDGKAQQLTPEWWEMVRFSMEEADRLGLKLGMHICDGFALAGGPWITPEESMQKVVWSDTIVNGGKLMAIRLPQPEAYENYYEDIALFALPVEDAADEMQAKITCVNLATTGNVKAAQTVNMDAAGVIRSSYPCYIQYEYEQPFTCRNIEIVLNGNNYQAHRLKVMASDDGVNYRLVKQLVPARQGWQNTDENSTHSIPPTTARFFRFYWTPEGSEPGSEDMDAAKWKPNLKIKELRLHREARLNQWEGKAGLVWRVAQATKEEEVGKQDCYSLSQVINLTKQYTGLISFILTAGIILLCLRVAGAIYKIPDLNVWPNYEDLLETCFNLIIGVELIKMMYSHSPQTVFEVLLFAIARQIIIDHSSIWSSLVGVCAIAVLFATRKFLFCNFDDADKYIFHASAKAKNIARLLSIDLPYSGNDTLEEVMLDQLKKENINNEIGACVFFKSFGLRIAKKSDGKISRIEVIRAIH